MYVSRFFCLFILYSFLGWIYESIFCTVKNRRWENRGFLYGPLCPIYGVGALVIQFVASAAALPAWALFLVAAAGSAVLEYATSWLLEKLFHALWWDYSRLPLNLHGRISLFTSLGFGLAGLLIVHVLAPFLTALVDAVPPAALEALGLVLMGLLAADLALTVSALTNFRDAVRRLEDGLNGRMDGLVESVSRRTSEARQRLMAAYRPALRRVRSFRFPRLENEKLQQLLRRAGGRDGARPKK